MRHETSEVTAPMGRPPLRKTGPMTAAERQRRHRRRIRAEHRQAEVAAKRERNEATHKDAERQLAKKAGAYSAEQFLKIVDSFKQKKKFDSARFYQSIERCVFIYLEGKNLTVARPSDR